MRGGTAYSRGAWSGQFPERLDLDIAPLAAGFARLNEPKELGLDVAGKASTRTFATTGHEK